MDITLSQSLRRRAPRGYRIVRWLDGSYHVYRGSGCIDEVLTRREALEVALKDKAERARQVAQGCR